MADNETEYVFSAKDEVTPVVTGLITALGRLNTQLPVTDKSLTRFESSLASAATKAGLLGKSVEGTAPAMTKAQQALAAYQKQVNDFEARGARTNSAGRTVDAGGRFISKADVQAYEQALGKVKLLTDSEKRMAETRAALNNRDLARNIQAQAQAYSSLNSQTVEATSKSSRLAAVLQNVPPNSTRYALYDVAQSLAVLGAALTAGAIASVGFAASYERAFADVKRTVNDLSSEGLSNLNKELQQLAATTPVTFQELSHIASLGGQLGIAGSGIDEFVESVAKISTVSDLTVDKAATAFGRFKAILGVPEEEFENLASSILKVGVNSVATESQIVNITTQIASMAGFAGFTAEQVVGLSGALASIGAPPELSRGVVTRVFANMSKAVSEGGLKLERFAELSGVSSEQFAKAWGSEEFADVFTSFMRSIGTEGAGAVATLNELGITSVRDVPLLMRLAGATSSTGVEFGLLRQTMDDAAVGWKENSELTKQYDEIAGTFVEQLKVLGNNFANLAATIGGPLLSVLKPALNGLIQILQALGDFASTPVGGTILALTVGFSALLGVLLLFGAGLARAVAGVIAMQTATNGLVGSFTATKAALVGMNANLAVTPGALAKTSVAAKGVAGALTAAVGPIGLVIAGLSALIAFAPQISDLRDSIGGISFDFDPAFGRLMGAGDGAITRIKDMGAELIALNRSVPYSELWRNLQATDEGIAQMVESGNVREAIDLYSDLKRQAKDGGVDMKEFNAALPDAAAAFRELAPEAKNTAEAIAQISDESDPALERLQKLQDTLKQGAIDFINTGDLIKENQDIQKQAMVAWAEEQGIAVDEVTADMVGFYDAQSVHLPTYLNQLQQQVDAQNAWKANMQTLADRGVSEEILADLGRLGPEGAPLVAALVDGSAEELERYKALWKEAGQDSAEQYAIGMVTTQIKIENAMKALGTASQEQFLSALNEGMPLETALTQWGLDALGNPIPIYSNPDPAYDATNTWLAWARRQSATIQMYANITAYGNPAVIAALNGQGFSTTGPAGTRINVGQFAEGGYTGAGGKYQPAGIVHKGEFVMPQEAVNRIGISNLYSMMRSTGSGGQRGSYARGGLVGGGMPSSMIVELSPYDRYLLEKINSGDLVVGNDVIQRAANDGAVTVSNRGKM